MTLGDRLGRVFPWGVEAGLRSVVLTAGCGVGLVVVWWGVADRGVFSTQVGWLAAGVAVLMVSLYGHASLVIRGRRAIGERRAALVSDDVVDVLPRLAALSALKKADRDELCESGVAVVNGFELFHGPGCVMTSGRDTTVVSRRNVEGAGLVPCGICGHSSMSAADGERLG